MKVSELIEIINTLDDSKDILIGIRQGVKSRRATPIEVEHINTDKENNVIVFTINCKKYDLTEGNNSHSVGDIVEARNEYMNLDHADRYKIYLKSERWRKKKEKVLKRDNYICQSCLKNPAVEVHHTTYKYLGFDPLFVLKSICQECHTMTSKMDSYNKGYKKSPFVYGGFADYLIVEKRMFDTYLDTFSSIEHMNFRLSDQVYIGDSDIIIGEENDNE